MNDPLEAQERAKYHECWTAMPNYRLTSPAARRATQIRDFLKASTAEVVADIGCGSGKVIPHVTGRVLAIDFDQECLDEGIRPDWFLASCLWDLPPGVQADAGYCIDVMEHIPPERVDAVLDGIRLMVDGPVYFHIALNKASHKGSHGPLHLTVESGDWWQAKLEEHWGSVERKAADEYLVRVPG